MSESVSNVTGTQISNSPDQATIDTLNGTPAPEAVEATEAPQATEPQVEVAKPEDNFTSKFAALSRREKQLRQREAASAQKEKEWQAKLAKYEQDIKERDEKLNGYSNFEEQYKLNPLKAIKSKYGTDYEKLTEIALNEGNPTPEMMIQRIREEMDEKYKNRFEELDKKEQEKERQAAEQDYQRREQAYLSNLTEFVNKNKDAYELTIANDAVNLVYEVQQEHYKQTLETEGEGRVLSEKEAADQVEQYLEEELDKYTQLQKVQKKLAGASKPKDNPAAKPAPGNKSVTLTNSLSQQAPKADRKLSDDESKREVAKLLRWEE